MTQEEINAYIELQNKFQLECEKISDEFGRYKFSYGYLHIFSLDGDNVYGEGFVQNVEDVILLLQACAHIVIMETMGIGTDLKLLVK